VMRLSEVETDVSICFVVTDRQMPCDTEKLGPVFVAGLSAMRSTDEEEIRRLHV